MSDATTLDILRPTSKALVMQLVADAGIDVSGWALRADGAQVQNPAANPAYCYEWSWEDAERVVFSLWFAQMLIVDGVIQQRVNMRRLRRRIEAAKHIKPGAKTAMVNRAVALDLAVQHAFRAKLPVRVIVVDGERRDLDDPADQDPAHVELRMLDPSPWHVASYDYLGATTGGDAVLVRNEAL